MLCPETDCPDHLSGREFANAGALRFHAIAKHRAAAGFCDLCGKEFQNLASHQGKMHKADAGGGRSGDTGGPPAGADTPYQDTENDTGERMPEAPPGMSSGPSVAGGKRRLSDRVRGKLWGKEEAPTNGATGGGAYATAPGERRPKARNASRSTTSPLLSMAWGGLGSMLIRSGADVPVGRVMQFQAPMAGDILDRLVARTWVDRLLQPLASKTDEVEALGALFALPVLIGVMERSPEGQALYPIVRQVVEANLVNMAPVVKKRKADAKKMAEAVRELELDLPVGPDGQTVDAVDAILSSIFAPPPTAAEPMPAASDAPA